ncbi:MAG: SLC26A/SulP transporter family protein [Deltaproteobacteria bacterium]|nr:SLC26A/SulP transporter family protein [Deltaproteobacteria bacterium]
MPGTSNWAGEIWGGLAAMLVALPSSIAFGLVIYSTLGPDFAAQGAVVGILGTIALGLVAPVFGGTPRLISAPCAPAAAVMAALAADLLRLGLPDKTPTFQPEQVILLLTLAAALAGALQFLFGAAGGGRLIKYIPYPVVAGFLSGVGALIFLSQFPKLFGLPKGTDWWRGLTSPALWQWPGLIVGVVTMVVMIFAPRVTRAIPAPILGLLSGVVTYFTLGTFMPELLTLSGNRLVIGPVTETGGSVLDALAERLTSVSRLNFEDLNIILVPALTLAVLLSIDTLKSCVIVDALTHSRHNSNRELVGQGLGNMAAALAGGLPGAGTLGATLVNIYSGGQSRLSSILEGVFSLVAFLLLGSLVAWVPIAALAGILLVIASRMIDRNSFHLLRQESTIFDFAVVAAVVVTAISVNLIAAAGVGLALAILLFLREQIRGTVVRRKSYGNQSFSKKRRLPEEAAVLEEKGEQTAIYELQGNLFFGTTDQLFTELEDDLKTRKYVILDMRRVQFVDFTAAHMLEQIEAQLAAHKGDLLFADLPPTLPTGQDLQTYFDQVGLVKPSRNALIFNELDDALEWTEDQILTEERVLLSDHESLLELHEINLFKGIDGETLTALYSCLTEKSFAAGERIFNQGDTGGDLFMIRRGAVRIVLLISEGKSHHIATFARGDFFGDMSFLDHSVRSADAIAFAATDLYVLPRAGFDKVADDHPAIGKKVFARLARALAIRLRQTDAELRALEES